VRAPVVEVTLLVGMAPVITLGIERLRGREVPPRQVLGVILAVGGLVAFLAPSEWRMEAKLNGDVLALGAATASALYAVQLRRMGRSNSAPDPVFIAAMACLVGAVGGSALAWIFSSPIDAALTPHDIGMLVLLGALSTALPTAAYSIASARLPTVLTTSLGLSTPLFAALFAGTLLGQWPTQAMLPGVLITLLGLALVVRTPTTSQGADRAPRAALRLRATLIQQGRHGRPAGPGEDSSGRSPDMS